MFHRQHHSSFGHATPVKGQKSIKYQGFTHLVDFGDGFGLGNFGTILCQF
jgi:hypothetical protein